MELFKYNPLQKTYKSVTGGVEQNKECVFCVDVLNTLEIESISLAITKDGESYVNNVPMKLVLHGEQYDRYSVAMSFTCGLYWYCFEIASGGYVNSLGIADDKKAKLFYGKADCYQLLAYNAASESPNWLHSGVMYQIFVDRFNHAGEQVVPSGDRYLRNWGEQPEFRPLNGVVKCNDFFGGNLRGIEKKLDYLTQFNVKAIYLCPIFKAYSNHKYDTEDYESIDEMFGSTEDFVSLCNEAQKRGIRIILDGVFNHSGVDSKYFNRAHKYQTVGAYQSEQSPYHDWFRFSRWQDRQYDSWWGISTLPSHNFGSNGLREYIAGANGILRKWLSLGASGYRLDVVDELPDDFLDIICQSIKKYDKSACVIGEVWEDATTKCGHGKRRRYFLGGQLDSVMNYPLKDAIIEYVRNGKSQTLSNTMFDICNNYPAFARHNLMTILDSHDTVRIINAVAGKKFSHDTPKEVVARESLDFAEYVYGVQLLKMASLLQYTLVGFPSVFYGDEAGVTGYGDPFCRVCYPWEKQNMATMQHYVWLGGLREYNCIATGEYKSIRAENGLFAYMRYTQEEQMIIALNKGEQTEFTFDGTYKELSSGEIKSDSITLHTDSFAVLYRKNS